jgi:protein arginine N-methyltransferase 1
MHAPPDIGDTEMYSVADYNTMIADKARMDAYVQALSSAITPDSVVLDIGSGTGIFALLACKFGARQVYAVEPNDAIQVAAEIARANGFEDRIEFIQELSTKITLPGRVDVIVSDLRGALPLYGRHIPAIVDARQRFLTPGGTMIAKRDTLWASIAAAPSSGRSVSSLNGVDYGLDMDAAKRIAANTIQQYEPSAKMLLVEPQCWATLDYAEICEPDVSADITWTVSRGGTGDGLCIWYDAEVAEGVGFSNAPGEPESVYGRLFLPWLEPVDLTVGDAVSVSLQANLIDDDYLWRWTTRIFEQDSPTALKLEFKQSTFFGVPVSPRQLLSRASSYVPTLAEDGEIASLVLASIDGSASLGDIARKVANKFPIKFASEHDALRYVSRLSKKYS